MSEEEKPLPFVAPHRPIAAVAPFRWLRGGLDDFNRSLTASLAYGAALAAISYAVAALAWQFGTLGLYIGLATGFVFVAPLLAVGVYSLSRRLEAGEPPSFAASLRDATRPLRDLMLLGLVLLVVLLVWARAVATIHIFMPNDPGAGVWEVLPFTVVGVAVGGIFASVIFGATAFALPMVLDRDADAITAALTSTNAVLRNKPAALLWGGMIVTLVGVSFATAFIGLIVAFPVLGHATGRAYRETIDASAWPERLGRVD
jgi:uncharacterized membrane protein